MNGNKQGTALITGASSGIGEAFARELGARNYDLVIIARRKDKLEELARELKNNYSVSVDVIVADLSTEKSIAQVEEYIKKVKNLDILINNAGFGTRGYFSDVSPEKSINMINVHVLAPTRFCRAALPCMIKRDQGSIINVSSLASFCPIPGNAIYNATKSYLNMFSRSIQSELKNYNIKVQALCPGFAYTGFHDTDEFKDFDRSSIPKWLWMFAQEVVEQSLKALSKNKVIFIPGIKNRILAGLLKIGGKLCP
ncbi:SDR family oxidoreductase [candidate division WOR-3 bacterium]|nr:SDR family oxidoreductase [candidate division WOR-3 bacterium]